MHHVPKHESWFYRAQFIVQFISWTSEFSGHRAGWLPQEYSGHTNVVESRRLREEIIISTKPSHFDLAGKDLSWWRECNELVDDAGVDAAMSFASSHLQTCPMVNTYTTEKKQATVAQVQAGATVIAVAAATGVHDRTIRKWLAATEGGRALVAARPGPKPFFPQDAEQHLYDWIVGRQLVGRPVGRSTIIRKAQEVVLLGCGSSIGDEWYKRFKERYLSLTGGSAQSLSLKRNCVVPADLTTLFNTLARLVIELKLDHSRVFNMDETAFQKQLKTKKVVAVLGSSNVWNTEPTANFHFTVVACGSASGFVVPPAFILPGKTVSPWLLDECEVPGAAVTRQGGRYAARFGSAGNGISSVC